MSFRKTQTETNIAHKVAFEISWDSVSCKNIYSAEHVFLVLATLHSNVYTEVKPIIKEKQTLKKAQKWARIRTQSVSQLSLHQTQFLQATPQKINDASGWVSSGLRQSE